MTIYQVTPYCYKDDPPSETFSTRKAAVRRALEIQKQSNTWRVDIHAIELADMGKQALIAAFLNGQNWAKSRKLVNSLTKVDAEN